MAEKQRTGLVSYGGDSEVSDSEMDEEGRSSSPPTTVLPQVMANSLGIPSSKPRPPSSPPSFVKPIVHSAPLGGLVAYYGDEDEDHNESTELDESMAADVFDPPTQAQFNEDAIPLSQDHLDSPQPDPPEELPPTEEDSSQDVESQPVLPHPLFLPLDNVFLPPEPTTPCSKALQEKVKMLLQKQAALGIDVNRTIQARKDFRNPSIYKKLIEFSNLEEFGTNYPEHLYNPHEWTEEDYYDNLSKAQKKAHEKRERARLERSKIEFVTGTKRPVTASQGLLGARPTASEPLKKRKSKWDTGTNSGGSRGASPTGTRPPLLGSGPVGAQAKAQASLMNIS